MTAVNFRPQTGEIRNAEIQVNEVQYAYSHGGEPREGHVDLENTLAHEVGHALGFGHSRDSSATMYGGSPVGETQKRSLHQDDVDGLCERYREAPVCQSDDAWNPFDDSPDTDDSSEKSDGIWDGADADSARRDDAACSVTTPGGSGMVTVEGLFGLLAFWLVIYATRTRRKRANQSSASTHHGRDRTSGAV